MSFFSFFFPLKYKNRVNDDTARILLRLVGGSVLCVHGVRREPSARRPDKSLTGLRHGDKVIDEIRTARNMPANRFGQLNYVAARPPDARPAPIRRETVGVFFFSAFFFLAAFLSVRR